jgi:small-conductance mechanosensitive channel
MWILDTLVAGNSLKHWGIALGVAIAAYLVMEMIRRVLVRSLGRFAAHTKVSVDDLVVHLLKGTRGFFLAVLAVYFATMVLTLPAQLLTVVRWALAIATVVQGGFWGDQIIGYLVSRHLSALGEDPAAATTLSALSLLGRLVLWSVLILFGLSNLGIQINTLIASLGIGGVAVALAVQRVLGDLLASLSIVLDKPFVIGDFIIVDDLMGTVEHIGLKTTRLRSLSGEQLVFGNSDLLNSRIRNYKRMAERRILFGFGVTYDTPRDLLEKIPGIVKELITSEPQTRFDRAHFKEYGDSSLNFEVVYYVLSADYNAYMDIQQRVNLELYSRFADLGIEFAFPTRTVYLVGQANQASQANQTSQAQAKAGQATQGGQGA